MTISLRVSSLRTWWANHLYPAVGVALAVTLLAGGAVLAAAQRAEGPAEQSASSRISEARSAAILLDFEPEVAPETVAPDVSAEADAPATSAFEVSCPAAKALPAQNADVFDCKVTSRGSFSAPVSLTCVKPPAGLTCTPDPATVTPPAGGSVEFHLSLSNNNVKPGKHSFRVVGTSGALTGSFTWPFDTSGTKAGDYLTEQGAQVYCTFLPMNRIARGETVSTPCGYQATFAFKGSITPSCIAPPGITCSVSPNSVSPRFPDPVPATLTLTAAHDAPLGKTTVAIKGSSAAFNSEFLPHNDLPFDVVTPSGGTATNDYAITCSPPVTTLTVGASANIACEVSSGAFSGAVSLMWLGLDANSPFLTPSHGIINLQPGGRSTVNLLVNNPNVVVGTFRYVVTVQHNGAYNYSAGGDTDKSRTIVVQVTPAPEPPPPTP